uniref:Uncharacterized protein n=1 Tax=Caenorhabditis japonica TaxID=281687 RepID=A0A8R1EQS6_CAEJA
MEACRQINPKEISFKRQNHQIKIIQHSFIQSIQLLFRCPYHAINIHSKVFSARLGAILLAILPPHST